MLESVHRLINRFYFMENLFCGHGSLAVVLIPHDTVINVPYLKDQIDLDLAIGVVDIWFLILGYAHVSFCSRIKLSGLHRVLPLRHKEKPLIWFLFDFPFAFDLVNLGKKDIDIVICIIIEQVPHLLIHDVIIGADAIILVVLVIVPFHLLEHNIVRVNFFTETIDTVA